MSLPPQSDPEFVNGLRSPGIGSKESIPPAYIGWRARVLQIDCGTWESFPGLPKRFTNLGSGVAFFCRAVYLLRKKRRHNNYWIIVIKGTMSRIEK